MVNRENKSTCCIAASPLMSLRSFSSSVIEINILRMSLYISCYERLQPSFSASLSLSLHPSTSSFSSALLSGRNSVAMVISIAVIATPWWGGPAEEEGDAATKHWQLSSLDKWCPPAVPTFPPLIRLFLLRLTTKLRNLGYADHLKKSFCSPWTFNNRAPQGCDLNPLLVFLYIYDCTTTLLWNLQMTQ